MIITPQYMFFCCPEVYFFIVHYDACSHIENYTFEIKHINNIYHSPGPVVSIDRQTN